MIVCLLGYYIFILDKKLDVKKHFKLLKEVQRLQAQRINLSPTDVQVQQIRRSLEQAASRLNEQIGLWTDIYRNVNRRNGDQ